MRLLNVPIFTCPECYDTYDAKVDKEKASVTFKHFSMAEHGLYNRPECSKVGNSVTKSLADFSVEL